MVAYFNILVGISILLFVLYIFTSKSLENFTDGEEEVKVIIKEKKIKEKGEKINDVDSFVKAQNLAKNADKDLPVMDFSGDSLCTSFASQPMKLNESCGTLSKTNCNATSCCVWLNETSCVAGDKNGPTFRTTKGKPIEVENYMFKGRMYGSMLKT